MDRRVTGVLLQGTLFIVSGWADTMTLRNNAEVNGRITYQNDAFTVTSRYRGGSKTFKFDRAEVRTIEINRRDFNAGEPPKDISIFDERSSSEKNASQEQRKVSGSTTDAVARATPSQHQVLASGDFNPSTDDVIWLRNKTKLTGRLLSIESGHLLIKQGKKEKQVQMPEVTTVLVAPN